MMKGWTEGRIRDFGRVVTGKTPPTAESEYFGGGELFVSPKDLEFDSRYIFETETAITEKALAKFKNQVLPPNAVMFTSLSYSFGKVGIASRRCLTNQQINSIIVKPEHDFRFVYYLLRVYKPIIFSFNSGIDTPLVPKSVFEKVQVFYPNLKTQEKIASLLSAYDDLIENNQRRIAILEKMAEEIYREWFVRMRFSSDAKASENKPTLKLKGLPAGWRIGMVKDLGKVVTGKTPPTSEARYYGDRYPFIKTPDMHSSVFLTETGEQLSEEGFAFQRSQQIPARSICASCIGTAGVIGITTEPSQTNQQINSIVLKDDTHLEWAYFTILGLRELMNLFGATGATMTNISKGKFERLPIILPPQRVIQDFHSLVAPLFDSILNLTQQVRALKTTRDLLLPRLISGRLSVENLELPSNEKLTSVTSALPQQELAHA